MEQFDTAVRPRLLTEREAGTYTGHAPATLRNMRHLGTGPTYVKVGRAVRYRVEDLEAYVNALPVIEPMAVGA